MLTWCFVFCFWENHDPTQGDRQGNDRGSQYRSLIICTTKAQRELAEASRRAFGETLANAGRGSITTEILETDAGAETRGIVPHIAAVGGAVEKRHGCAVLGGIPFWLAEDYHQAYLFHNPGGYCNHGFKGFVCEVPGRG